jgi:mycobactin lysine-N-oxygenase
VTVSGDAPVADLLIVGAGAKAAAVAAKVHVINGLGYGPITLTIVEGNRPAASWLGLNGMTSGEEPLAVTPIKDVGFPYESGRAFGAMGEEIDRALMPFSWQQYLIGRGTFARWVNAGSPPIRHRDYGEYLAWVLAQTSAGITHVQGRVEQVSLTPGGERWAADVAEPAGARRYAGRAMMLTGPGVHRHLPHDPSAAPRMFHCDSKRSELDRIPTDRRAEIAIIGGGESALSCLAFLRGCRPAARLTVYTPTLPMSRGESFLENRVFANPDEVSWSALDLATRRTFIKHADRGVFDAGSLAAFAYDDHCRFLTGRVVHVAAEGAGDGVCVDCTSADGPSTERYDYVVNCTGFDLLEQLRGLFPPAVREEIERHAGPVWNGPATEIAIGRTLELAGLRPRLHIPALAGLSQGPGFANLGSLGLVANRVLQPLLLGDAATSPTTLATG